MQVLGKVARRFGHKLDCADFDVEESLEHQWNSAIGAKANFHNFFIQIVGARNHLAHLIIQQILNE